MVDIAKIILSRHFHQFELLGELAGSSIQYGVSTQRSQVQDPTNGTLI
jgi:hypothetical protein